MQTAHRRNKWTDMAAPHPEVSTAYTAYVMGLMAQIAEHLGKAEDAALRFLIRISENLITIANFGNTW